LEFTSSLVEGCGERRTCSLVRRFEGFLSATVFVATTVLVAATVLCDPDRADSLLKQIKKTNRYK
jgi:hypothetical protein